MSEIRTITVLGAGDMGHGIAELAALRGFDVRLRDIKPEILDRAMEKVRWSLDKLVGRNTVTKEQADAAFARITATVDLAAALKGTGLVIEAVPEDLGLKQRIFAEVEAAAPTGAVLASNTSTMLIGDIGAKLKDPGRLVGMHFFNPVLLMDLIEVIPGPRSSPQAIKAVEDVSARLGRQVVTLKKDSPGFVTSRLVGAWVGASVLAFDAGVAKPEAIDSAMKFKAGFPMGPFELADFTGLDIGLHAGDYIASKLGPAYTPSKTMRARVEKGDLGKKTGKGFYTWKDNRVVERIDRVAGKDFETTFILAIVANEAARLMDEGVASAADIDKAMRLGCAFPKGPLEWADDVGLDRVVQALEFVGKGVKSKLLEPAGALQRLVDEGKTGKKSGAGFYAHASAASDGPKAESLYDTLIVDVDPAVMVGTITLNRPHRLHAINDQLIKDLTAAIEALEARPDVRCILITASGDKAFCVGADLQDAEGFSPALASEVVRRGHMACIRIEKCAKPVVAAINGYAVGGGLELALACDLRVAARRAKIGLPEVTLGLLPAMGGTQRLPKLVGLSRAKEIALLGERIEAQKAHEWGLVHRVFENEAFAADAKAFAALVAARAPIALQVTKQLLNAAPTTDVLTGMEAEALAFGLLSSTEDVVEGVSSMFMKKKPEFKGK